jgi:hypothetical protein
MLIAEVWRAGKVAWNAGDSVAIYEGPSVCDVGLQTMKEMQLVKEDFDWMVQSCSYKGCTYANIPKFEHFWDFKNYN